MKRIVTTGYVFSPSAGTIDLSAITGMSFGGLLAIIDKTTNTRLYVDGLTGYGGTYSSANVLTLQASASGCASSDVLQIIFDDGVTGSSDAELKLILAALQGGLTVSDATSEAALATTNTTLSSVLTVLKAQVNLSDNLVVDGSGAYWVRRETDNEGVLTVAFETLAGVAGTPSGTLSPVTGGSRVAETAYYDVTVAGSATAVGDIIARTVIYDTVAASIAATVWQNVTQGTTITAATAGTYVEQTKDVTVAASALPAGAALEAGNLASILAALGSKTDAVPTSLTASASLIALIRLMATYESTIAGAISSSKMQTAPQSNAPSTTATGTLSAAASSVVLAVDGYNTATIQLSGTWSGALTFFGSADGGTTYYALNAVPYGGGAAVAGASANGLWELAVGGLTHLQVLASAALTSGAATALLRATTGLKSVRVGTAASNPLLTNDLATAFSDASGTTSSTASTVTVAMAANASRRYARITNLASSSSTAIIYVYDKASGTPTTSNSIPLQPGQSYEWAKPPTNAISVFSASTSIAYEAAQG